MSTVSTPEPIDAGTRLFRLLGVLAYLAEVGEADISELAARFSMEPASLVAELELAACCGLPPYTPDQLLELVVDDERVYAYGLGALRRPPQLTASEGFAVAAAARALLAVPGTPRLPALASALEKLERAIGSVEVSIELDQPDHLGVLARAAAEGEIVDIDYRGASSGEETHRSVEPFSVVAREGHFYLDAYCHLAGDWRRFQVDRVRGVRPTGLPVEARTPPPEFTGSRAFAGGPSVRLAKVAVPVGRQVLLERVAAGAPEPYGPGRVLVPIEVADERWFGALLLRLGDDAELVEPESLASSSALAATRILSRYQSHPTRGAGTRGEATRNR